MAGMSFGEEMTCKDIVCGVSEMTIKDNARGSLPSLAQGGGVGGGGVLP